MLNKELLNKISKEQPSSIKNVIDDMISTVMQKYDMSESDFCDVFDINKNEFNENNKQLYRLIDEDRYNKLLIATNNKNEDMLKVQKNEKQDLLNSFFHDVINKTEYFLTTNDIEIGYDEIRNLFSYLAENVVKTKDYRDTIFEMLNAVDGLLGMTNNKEPFFTTYSCDFPSIINCDVSKHNDKCNCGKCISDEISNDKEIKYIEQTQSTNKEVCTSCGNEKNNCTCGCEYYEDENYEAYINGKVIKSKNFDDFMEKIDKTLNDVE